MSTKLVKLCVVLTLLISFPLFSSLHVQAASSQFVAKGTSANKVVALTFDDGADGTNIEKILSVLADHQITATFFLTGSGTKAHPRAVKKIIAAGYDIGNHSYSHPDFTTLSAAQMKNELNQTEAMIKSTTGKSSKPLFRAPFGAVNSAVLSAAGSAGFTHTIQWNIDTLDWKGTSSAAITNKVMDHIVPGSIILMHTGEGASGTPGALPTMISKLKAKGYKFVTVRDLLFVQSAGDTYVVKPGDTLYRIAKKYGMTVQQMAEMNHLADPSYIRAGQVLVISEPSSIHTYTVLSGDTLYSLARKYGVSVSSIVSANHLANASYITVGQVLVIPGQAEPHYTAYAVKAGDTLYSIARRYNTSVSKLVQVNHISNPDFLLMGTILKIPQ
ncbi:LysM peptidoglycan-binding domain-containing protein [Halobacillus rhizosphaerae]|uniref:LysM peptidoglycan-binding domain-containing protein n=1 Tax=Halobacillus rhizosphaerae TaxID=3064889 RepID=UPI00398A8080